jgi:hypothetical protein
MSRETEGIALAIKTARAHEKIAIAEAQRKAAEWVLEETKEQHEVIIESVRRALGEGMSARQIGMAYGSSDPKTAKRLILEAMGGTSTSSDSSRHPEWKLTRNDDETFNINAYSLGDAKLTGYGTFKLDDDGENFSLIDGDMWIQIQLYKLGYKDDVLQEAKGNG